MEKVELGAATMSMLAPEASPSCVVTRIVGASGGGDHGALIGRLVRACAVDTLLERCDGAFEAGGVVECVSRLDFDLAVALEVVGDLNRHIVHLEPAPGGGGHGGRMADSHTWHLHYPIAPSISSLIRLFISTAYSSGSSLETGFAKP